ncbi:MAG: hypothetical protein ACREDT_07140 [Methylocella sp.]
MPATCDAARLVCDYIAGMTDRYAAAEHGRLLTKPAAGTARIGSAREKRAVIICCPEYPDRGRKRTLSTSPDRGDRIALSMAASLGLKVWRRCHGLLEFGRC